MNGMNIKIKNWKALTAAVVLAVGFLVAPQGVWAATSVSGVGTKETFNVNGATASGTNATAVGDSATASGETSTAIGYKAKAANIYAVALGANANAYSRYSFAVGNGAITGTEDTVDSGGVGGIAIGSATTTDDTTTGATVTGDYGIALGTSSSAVEYSLAVGYGTSATAANAMALGEGATASGAYATALGSGASALADYTFAAGNGATVKADGTFDHKGIGGIAIGSATTTDGTTTGATVLGEHGIAIGTSSSATIMNAVAIGYGATASHVSALALGNSSYARGWYSIAIGDSSSAVPSYSIVIGRGAKVEADTLIFNNQGSIAIGSGLGINEISESAPGANVKGNMAIAIGTASSTDLCSVSIGAYATGEGGYTTIVGYQATAEKRYAIALGTYARAKTEYSMAIGVSAAAVGQKSMVIGADSTAYADYSLAYGNGVIVGNGTNHGEGNYEIEKDSDGKTIGYGGIAIGNGSSWSTSGLEAPARVAANYGIAIGMASSGYGEKSVALGYLSRTYNEGTVSLGAMSHAEGAFATALGFTAQAYGEKSTAIGYQSVVRTDITTEGDNKVATVSFGHQKGDVHYEISDDRLDSEEYSDTVLSRLTNVANGVNNYDAATYGQLVNAQAVTTTTGEGDSATTSTTYTVYEAGDDGIVTVKTNDGGTAFKIKVGTSGGEDSLVIGDATKHWVDLVWNGAADSTSVTRGENSTAYGYTANAAGNYATALGYGAGALGEYSIAYGAAKAYDNSSIAIGRGAVAGYDGTLYGGVGGIAIGGRVDIDETTYHPGAEVRDDYGIAIGTASNAMGYSTTALGFGATAWQSGAISIGSSYAYGMSSIAIGQGGGLLETRAEGNFSIAIGGYAGAYGYGSTAINYEAKAYTDRSVVIGYKATAGVDAQVKDSQGVGGIAIGSSELVTGQDYNGAKVTGDYGIAIGTGSSSFSYATAFGYKATASLQSIALGYKADASNAYNIAIGAEAKTVSTNTIAIGHSASSEGGSGIAIGNGASASSFSIAIGSKLSETLVTSAGYHSVAIGSDAVSSGSSSTAINYGAKAYTQSSIAIGDCAIVGAEGVSGSGGVNGIAVGRQASVTADGGIAIGLKATVSPGVTEKWDDMGGIAIGNGAEATDTWTIAIGYNAEATDYEAVALGHGAKASGDAAVAIGNGAQASTFWTVAAGASAEASGYVSIALGYAAGASSQYSTAIGQRAKASGDYASAIGYQARVTAANAVALGSNSVADAENVVSVGYSYTRYEGTPFETKGEVTRKIVHVTDGTESSDAATYGQLVNAQAVTTTTGEGESATTSTTYTVYEAGEDGIVTVKTNDGGTAFKIKVGTSGGGSYVDSDTISIDSTTNQLRVKNMAQSTSDTEVANGMTTASGIAALALGSQAAASGQSALAIGTASKAMGNGAVALGATNQAKASNASALGVDNKAYAHQTTAIGYNNTAGDTEGTYSLFATAIGSENTAVGYYNVALGGSNKATGEYFASAIGLGNTSSGISSSAFGYGNTASGNASSAFGANNKATNLRATAMGTSNQALEEDAMAFGIGSIVTANKGMAFGYSAYVGAGDSTTADATGAVAIGNEAVNTVSGTVSFGHKQGDFTGQYVYTDTKGNTHYSATKEEGYTAETYASNQFARLTNVAYGTDKNDAAAYGQIVTGGSYNSSAGTLTFTNGAGETAFTITGIGAGGGSGASYTAGQGIAIDTTTDNPTISVKVDGSDLTVSDNGLAVNKTGTVTSDSTGIVTGQTVYNSMVTNGTYDESTGRLTFTKGNGDTSFSVAINGTGVIYKGDDKTISVSDSNQISLKYDTTDLTVGDNGLAVKKDGKVESGNTSLVTGGAVYDAMKSMDNQVAQLSDDIHQVGAGAAALAALHPEDYDPNDKVSFAVGYGHYKGANAGALGAFFKPNEDTTVSMASTIGNGDPMVNLGVSFKLGNKGKKAGTYRSAVDLVNRIDALEANMAREIQRNKIQDSRLDSQEKRIAQLEADNARLQQQIANLLSGIGVAIR